MRGRAGNGNTSPLRRFAPAPPKGATTTTAASGGNRKSLLGQRPARRKRSAADAGSRNPGAKHLWHVGQVTTGRAKHDVSGTVVLRCLGSRQLDKERCPEVAALCSKARSFASYQTLGVQSKAARHASGSPFGSNSDDRRQWRKQGGAIGAAASRMRATAKQTLGAATRAVAPKVTERAAKNKQILSFARFCRLLFDGQRSIISFVQIFPFEFSQNHQM